MIDLSKLFCKKKTRINRHAMAPAVWFSVAVYICSDLGFYFTLSVVTRNYFNFLSLSVLFLFINTWKILLLAQLTLMNDGLNFSIIFSLYYFVQAHRYTHYCKTSKNCLTLSLYSEEGITEYAYLCASNYKMRNLFWSYILVWCGKEIVWISHLVFCNSTGSMTDRQKDQNKISHFAIECVMIHSWRAEVLAAWWPNAKKEPY